MSDQPKSLSGSEQAHKGTATIDKRSPIAALNLSSDTLGKLQRLLPEVETIEHLMNAFSNPQLYAFLTIINRESLNEILVALARTDYHSEN